MSLQSVPQEQTTLMKTCPLCEETYKSKDICVVENREDAQLYHVTCHSCNYAMLTFVLASENGMGSIGLLTDLHADDVHRLRGKSPITHDDILTFHRLLKRNRLIV